MSTKNKALVWIASVLIAFASVMGIGLFISHKTKINNHNESKYGIYEIALRGWDNGQTKAFQETLTEMNRLGPTFRIVNNEQQANVIVVNDSFALCTSERGAGRYFVGTRRIEINPACMSGDLYLQQTFMHEVGHSLGMLHIRRNDQDLINNSTSPLNFIGVAVMNPELYYSTPVGSNLPEQSAITVIQSIDIQEFKRVHP
jgi:hypothetical protein